MEVTANILQWFAFGGSLLSAWLYGRKGIWGPCAGILTAFVFIAFGLSTGLIAAILANIIFLGVHYRNLRISIMDDPKRISRKVRDATSVLVHFCHQAAIDAGWWHDLESGEPIKPDVPLKLCLMHSEISEAMEGHRKNLMDDKLIHRPMIEVELADLWIRTADLAGALDLDLAGAVAEKMEFNRMRPDHQTTARRTLHGKKY